MRLLTVAGGSGPSIAGQQGFRPWGSPDPGLPEPVATTRNYTGQQRDATGLLYYHARFYDPVLGRFISPDMVVPGAGALTAAPHDATATAAWGSAATNGPQDLNRYTYAKNNPMRYTDPTGHCWGVVSGLRNVPGYDVNCQNMDLALDIVQHPDASLQDKALAGGYVVAMGGAHVVAVAGTAVATGGAIHAAATSGSAAAATTATQAGSTAVTAACADGDCANEASKVSHVIERAFLAEAQRGGVCWDCVLKAVGGKGIRGGNDAFTALKDLGYQATASR